MRKFIFKFLLLFLTLSANAQITNNYYPLISAIASASYDVDAQAYFTANTSITSSSDKAAINTFYLTLKSTGVYTKIKAMYLPIWGSESANKWNLVNPLNTDGAYRMTYHGGGWSFSSSGETPNGTTSYANSHFLMDGSVIGQNSTHVSVYTRTNVDELGCVAGTRVAINGGINLWPRYSGNSYFRVNEYPSGGAAATGNDGRGFFIANRIASGQTRNARNGTFYTISDASDGLSGDYLYFGAAVGSGSGQYFSTNQQCFRTIGDGLTDQNMTDLTNAVNTLMTHFGINTF